VRRHARVAAFLLLPALLRAQTPAGDHHHRIARVENGLLTANVVAGRPPAGMRLADRMRYYRVPGLSIAVIDGGRIAWARAYGTAGPDGTPVDTGTLFQAASISKPVAAVAALRLVESGRLSLDEDVNARLVSWKVPGSPPAKEKPVTLRGILTHSAGLTVHGFRGYAPDESVPTLVQLLNGERPANSAPVRVDVVPGSQVRYSGGGFSVMQQLLVDVTGRPFPALMREAVLGPAGMGQSGYEQPLPAARAGRAAVGHRADGRPVAGRWHSYPEMAAAGLWTTPSDLARFAIELQRAYAGDGGRVLSPAAARQMLSRQAPEYGLGVAFEGAADSARFSHGGANEGYRAYLVAFREGGRGAVVMTNSDAGGEVAMELLRAVAREYGWPAAGFRPRERPAVDEGPAARRGLAGRYWTARGADTLWLTAAVAGDTLRAALPPVWVAPRPLYRAPDGSYFALEGGPALRFERDSSGTATAVLVELGPRPVRLERAK